MLSMLLHLVSENCLQEWILGRIIEVHIPKSLYEGWHIFKWLLANFYQGNTIRFLHFQKAQEQVKTHKCFLKINIIHLWWLKNSLSYKQTKNSLTKGKHVHLYSSYPSGMRDHKSKCGPCNEYTTNVNTNLFLPGEYFCYRYYHWKRTLIQTCLITW